MPSGESWYRSLSNLSVLLAWQIFIVCVAGGNILVSRVLDQAAHAVVLENILNQAEVLGGSSVSETGCWAHWSGWLTRGRILSFPFLSQVHLSVLLFMSTLVWWKHLLFFWRYRPLRLLATYWCDGRWSTKSCLSILPLLWSRLHLNSLVLISLRFNLTALVSLQQVRINRSQKRSQFFIESLLSWLLLLLYGLLVFFILYPLSWLGSTNRFLRHLVFCNLV